MHTPPIFATVAEARAAMANDKLATVYHSANKIFIATAFGIGTFTNDEWNAVPYTNKNWCGPRPCVVQTKPDFPRGVAITDPSGHEDVE